MSARKTTVTHEDGTISARSSKTMTYTHAVEIGPAVPELYAAGLRERADDQETKAAQLGAVLAKGPRVILRFRGAWVTRREVSHEATLAGTSLSTWADADGMTTVGYPDVQVMPALDYLVDSARSSAADYRDRAAQLRAEADAILSADAVPGDGWRVWRWSTRADLAVKALGEARRGYSGAGRVIRVVAVD